MNNLIKLELENFRVFRKRESFEFSKVNILTGPNNSGKSALIKALLLLKENVNSDWNILNFRSNPYDFGKHRIGDFDHAVNQDGTGDSFKAKLVVSPVHHYNVQDDLSNEVLELEFVRGENGSSALKSWKSVNEDGKPILSGIGGAKLSLSDLPAIKSFFASTIKYLPPFRNEGLAVYSKIKHQELWELMQDFQIQSTLPKLTSGQGRTPDFNAFLDRWLGLPGERNSLAFGIMDSIETLAMKDLDEKYFRLTMQRNGKEIDFSHLGSGAAQIFPIFLSIALGFEPTLILEEPETNLHPDFQSLLANIIVDASFRPTHESSKGGPFTETQYVIETHSEYLIRKLQYFVAKEIITPNEINIYYFHDPKWLRKAEDQVTKIAVNKDGNLSQDFGRGFFDEATFLITDLWKAQRGKN